MRIPIVSELLGSKPMPPPPGEANPVKIAGAIPIQQPGTPPTIEVVKEVSATEQIDGAWRKQYRGFDLKQIGYSNLTPQQVEILRLEFEIYQDVQHNFKLNDTVFDYELDKERLELIQDSILVENQARKAINAGLLNRVLAATNINKTEIQAGGIQKPEPKSVSQFLRI